MWHIEFFQKFDLPGQLKARTILRGVESDEAARETSTRLQALLGTNYDEASTELIRVLASCIPDKPCGSAACPLCDRMTRVKFVANACRRIAPDEADWSVVSIVPPGLGFRMNQLHFNPRGFKDQVCRHIEATELSGAPTVGSIGFAVQVIKRRFFWRPYLELVITRLQEPHSRCVCKALRTQAIHTQASLRSHPRQSSLADQRGQQYRYGTRGTQRRPMAGTRTTPSPVGLRRPVDLPKLAGCLIFSAVWT
jgi:hypothetical protein